MSASAGGKAAIQVRTCSKKANSSGTPAVGAAMGDPVERPEVVSESCSCSSATAGRSSTPEHAHRPTMAATVVGREIWRWPSGTVPLHPGGVSRKVPPSEPVARVPM